MGKLCAQEALSQFADNLKAVIQEIELLTKQNEKLKQRIKELEELNKQLGK